jgi:hypothetical protein
MALSAKFPTYRENSAQGQINLLSDTIKFCAIDIDDIGLGISGATNVSPIVITTASAHGYANDEEVLIWGVAGNTAANGAWKIANVTSSTFELVGSTGNGSYSGGTDYALNLNDLEFLGDITAGARIVTSSALASKAITNGYLTANNPTFTAPSGDAFELLALFKDTGDPATSPLIIISADSPSFPVSPNGVDDIEIIINDFIFRQ